MALKITKSIFYHIPKTGGTTNRGKQINNTSGHKGICWNKNAKKWMAEIKYRKKIYLSIYEFIEDAIKARKEAEKIYYNI